MPAVITSVKDPRLALIRQLDTVAGRRAASRCVLEGQSLVAQALQAGSRLDFVLIADGEATRLATELTANGVPTHPCTPAILRQALRTQRPVEALAVAELPAENDPTVAYGDFAVVLDGVLDPGNLGTIARTACGLGATDVVCTDPDVDFSSRKVLDASRAAALRVRLRRFDTPTRALDSLHDKGFQLVASSPHATVVQSIAELTDAPVALVVGNETTGVSDATLARCDHVVRIPMAGAVESLNVAVATGLSIYQLRERQKLAKLAATSPDNKRLKELIHAHDSVTKMALSLDEVHDVER
ncbi:MAG: RNA methyltransferase [Sciscionella sp.]|nr:RNA methyltransferase [Sciscionella sp.]